MNYELWTMNYELWTMNYELWTVNCELWTMNYELWTMNCELWNMNYELWTQAQDYSMIEAQALRYHKGACHALKPDTFLCMLSWIEHDR